MATTIKTTVAMNNGKSVNNSTKVVCPVCGAEIAIPEHEHVNCGVHVTIGKDSGLGTVVLPKADGKEDAIAKLMAMADGNPDMVVLIQQITGQIDDGGYLDVDGIVRRWIPSQCLSMLNSRWGFHKALQYKGYDYSWEVLLNDLKRQAKMWKKNDMEGYEDRNRWYNQMTAVGMALHYNSSLEDEINKMLGSKQKHTCKGKQYIKIDCWLNSGKGVYVNEVQKVINPFHMLLEHISEAQNPVELYNAVLKFNQLRNKVYNFSPEMYSGFMNAYKAAGSYYTIKDLILFEKCRIYGENTGLPFGLESSLNKLEDYANQISHDPIQLVNEGYKFLGFLKEFLNKNHFSFEATKQKWFVQSEERKQKRIAERIRRARK